MAELCGSRSTQELPHEQFLLTFRACFQRGKVTPIPASAVPSQLPILSTIKEKNSIKVMITKPNSSDTRWDLSLHLRVAARARPFLYTEQGLL